MDKLANGIAAALRFLILAALIIPRTPLRIIAAALQLICRLDPEMTHTSPSAIGAVTL